MTKWFFLKAPQSIIEIGTNYLAWGWHYFSIGYFAPRIFSSWHRDITPYGPGFELGRFLRTFGWNLISRVIGAVLRLFVMLFGLAIELLLLSVIVISFLLWFALPWLAVLLIMLGIYTVIT